MLRALLAAILATLAVAAAAQDPAKQPEKKPARVLFIGNSLTSTGNIPSRVAVLARDMGREVETEAVTVPGFSLEDHRRDGAALQAIRKGGWDFVVLQQGTSARDDSRRELIDEARRFAAEIRKAGAKPAIYMTWPPSGRRGEFPDAIKSHRMAAEAADAILIPAGEAWLRVMSKDSRLRLYADDLHPSTSGMQLAVLAIYLSLFPAGPQEFTEAYIRRAEKSLNLRSDLTDLFFDAVTLAIDEPMRLQ